MIKLDVALIIFNSFMDDFDVFLEFSWTAIFMFTDLALIIFDSFMDYFDVSFEVWLDHFFVTNVTFYLCLSHFFFGNSLQILIRGNFKCALDGRRIGLRSMPAWDACVAIEPSMSWDQAEIVYMRQDWCYIF